MGVVDVHHPYNLYLSCAACNIALSARYPTEIDKLIQENGTIGDWLMNGLLDATGDPIWNSAGNCIVYREDYPGCDLNTSRPLGIALDSVG